jgi:ABC-2 type transport system ATP-binding protein
MRQRLGIAQALIGDPSVLVLDEPANGLDPVGIRWMRGLLRDFASRGGTVLLSSHLLAEVQATVDRLVVIGGGRIVAQGELEQLLASAGVLVRALDPGALALALTEAGLQFSAASDDGALVVEDATTEQVGRIAAGAGLILAELRDADGAGLEDLFFSLTNQEAAA